MKTRIMKATLAVAFIAVAGYTAYNSQKEVELSDLAMANVEALAGGEWDGDNTCHMDTTFWECLKYTTGVGCYCGL